MEFLLDMFVLLGELNSSLLLSECETSWKDVEEFILKMGDFGLIWTIDAGSLMSEFS